MMENHPTGKLIRAIWKPGWHKLDQSIARGDAGRFWFFKERMTLHHHSPSNHDGDGTGAPSPGAILTEPALRFFNRLQDTDSQSEVRNAKVVEITHAELGDIARIDTHGLDYVIVTMDGYEYIVNAEESPGMVYDENDPVSEWAFDVTLMDVSEPLAELA